MASFLRAALFFLVLLVAPLFLCSSATTLDEEERQKEEEALESVDEAVSRGAADGAPEPPQNLVVFPQSPTSIMLSWTEPSDNTDLDHYVVYVEDEDMEDTTTYNYYIFNNLEACTDYTFGVMSVSAAGDTSDPLLGEGQTEVGAPPAPQNLQVDDYTSTTVTLSWDKPDTLCDVGEYRVRWGKDVTDTQSTTTSETSFTVTELSINTSYIFTVSGITSYGEGDEATVQQTTDVFSGGPPENLVAIGVSSSAINVSWSPAPGKPEYYKVTAPPCSYSEDMVRGLSYLITGLDPCKSCDISVTSHYEDSSEYTANVIATTDGGEPPPPESCSVEVEGDGLTVTWEEYVSDCPLDSHSIHWTGTKLWGDEEQESGSGTATGTGRRYNLPGTVPYSLYTFEISASIDGVFGSPASCSGKSSETQPGPPIILAADYVQGGALIFWETPVEENGRIVNYGIFVDEATNSQKNVSGDVHNTTLELESCKTFNLSVKAMNGAGWGLPSDVKNVSSEGNGPPPPSSCSVQVEEGALSVAWQEPDTSCPLGIYSAIWTGTKLWGNEEEESGSDTTSVTMFKLLDPVPYSQYTFEISASIDGVFGSPTSCTGTSLETEPGPPVIVAVDSVQGGAVVTWETPVEENGLIVNYGIYVDEATDPQVTVSGALHSTSLELDPCKTFGLSVKAENGAGWGSPSEVKDVTVVEDVLPKKVDCSAADFNVQVCWDPYDETCPVSRYNLMWEGDVLWSAELADSNSTSLEWSENQICYNISALPYTKYNVELTVGSGTQSRNCSATTPMAESSPPTTLKQTANDSSSVTITWGLPQYIRGELEGWHLRWTTLGFENIGEDTVNEVQRRTYTISELSESSTYVVYVSAVNGAGNGQEGKINASTAQVPAENSSNLGLIIGLSTVGGILLIILLVGSIILFLRRRSSKPPGSAPHMPEVADADSDELYKMQHLSSASQGVYTKHGSVDYGTNSELYMGPPPSLHEDKTINDGGPMPGPPPGRRYSQQVSTSLPRLEAYNRRPSQQVNTKLKNYEEYNRRPSQQELTSRPSFSGDPDKPSLGEYGRRPSQQMDVGRPSLKEYGRRPSQQVDLGRPNLAQYGRRRSQQIEIGRPASREYSRRPSQQLPSGGGSYPSRLSHEEAPRRSSVDLYSRRPSQQAADIGRPGDRMFMKRPSQQFIPSFEGIQEQ